MRYVLVNERVPKTNRYCALCTARLDDGYLREIDTRIKYCGVACYTEHCNSAMLIMGGIHGEVTQEMRLLSGPSRASREPLVEVTLLFPKT